MGDKEWGKGMRNHGKWGTQEWERRGGEGEIMGKGELGVGDNGKTKTTPSHADPHPDGCHAPALQPCFVAAHRSSSILCRRVCFNPVLSSALSAFVCVLAASRPHCGVPWGGCEPPGPTEIPWFFPHCSASGGCWTGCELQGTKSLMCPIPKS